MTDGRDPEALVVERCAANGLEIDVVAIGDQPWFVVDGLIHLGRSSSEIDAKVPILDKTQRLATWADGQKRPTSLLNELGLYRVLLTSKSPVATDLARWVFDEVVPAVRKSGRFRIFQEARRLDIRLNYTDDQWEWLRLNSHLIDLIPLALAGYSSRKISQMLGYKTDSGITVRKQVEVLRKHGLIPPETMTRRRKIEGLLKAN
jgi:prophage antirepressor-like protein